MKEECCVMKKITALLLAVLLAFPLNGLTQAASVFAEDISDQNVQELSLDSVEDARTAEPVPEEESQEQPEEENSYTEYDTESDFVDESGEFQEEIVFEEETIVPEGEIWSEETVEEDPQGELSDSEFAEEPEMGEEAVMEEDGFILSEVSDQLNAGDLVLSNNSVTIAVGDTYPLYVMDNGTIVSAQAWATSDPSVATVSNSGVVTGVAKGSAVITAIYNGTSIECIVSVVSQTTATTTRYNVLILDASNSMKGTPLEREKEAAKQFCKKVLSSDGNNYLAVVAYSDSAGIVCSMTNNLSALNASIDNVSAGGNTNMNEAFQLAGNILDAQPSGAKVIKNVILCSDGLPNTGSSVTSGRYTSSDHSSKYAFANAAYNTDVELKNKNYFIYALGFFHNSESNDLVFGKRLMKDLASKDKYYVITDPGDIGDALDDIADKITNITLNKTSITVKVGSTYQLNVTENGAAVKAVWKSSDTSVATVTSSGKVTGKKTGTATITVTYGGKTMKCKVTVANITLNKSSVSIYKDCTYTLTAKVSGKSQTVTWSSSDKSIATVTTSGKVTGKKAGTVTITASANGVKATCTVKVLNPTITLNKKSTSIYKDCSTTLTATVKGKSKTVTWSSSDKAVATVSSSGKVTGKKVGTVTITAKANGVKATCTVKVLKPTITLNKTKLTLYINTSEKLIATVKGKSKTVTWSSSRTSVAKVSSNGTVTALNDGTTTITASCNGVKATCKVTVIRKHPSYAQYFIFKPTLCSYGSKYIDEMGERLILNAGAKIRKCACFMEYRYDSQYRQKIPYFTIACVGDDITSARFEGYFSYRSKLVYTPSNVSKINKFTMYKNSDGIWTHNNYAMIKYNFEDAKGNNLAVRCTGVSGKNMKLFTDKQAMIDWLKS